MILSISIISLKYPFQIFTDRLYGMKSHGDLLGVNASVQYIDFLFGRGHYDHENYPFHAQLIEIQCKNLRKLISSGSLSLERRIDLAIGLCLIPILPVMVLINNCLDGISNAQFTFHIIQLGKNENCEKLETKGSNFITEDDQTSQMVCLYLRKSNIPITADNIRKQILENGKTLIADTNRKWTANDGRSLLSMTEYRSTSNSFEVESTSVK